MCSGSASLETSTTPSSPVAGLPQEVIEVIIANLIHNKRGLRTCSLACYSWYITSVPHLRRTLITRTYRWDQKLLWPNLLLYMCNLGLLPLVKELQITRGPTMSSPQESSDVSFYHIFPH